MPIVRKSDIDQLVLGYVAEERYIQTRNQLFEESPNLPEKVPILPIFGDISSENRLQTVLEEYVQFKTKQLVPICVACDECNCLPDLWKILDRILHKIRHFKPSEPSVSDAPQELQRYSPVELWQSLRSKSSNDNSAKSSGTLQRKRLNSVSHVYEIVSTGSREPSGSARRKRSKVTRRIASPEKTQVPELLYAVNGDLSALLHTSDRNDALALVGVNILSNMKKCAERGGGENEHLEAVSENVILSPLKQSGGPTLDVEDLISEETRGGLVEMTIDSLLNNNPDPAENGPLFSSTFSDDFSELRKLLEFDDTDSSCTVLPDIVQSQQDEKDLIDIIKADDDLDLPENPSTAMDYQTSASLPPPCVQSEDEKVAVAGLLAIRSTSMDFDSELPTISNIRSEGSLTGVTEFKRKDYDDKPSGNTEQHTTTLDSKNAAASDAQNVVAPDSQPAAPEATVSSGEYSTMPPSVSVTAVTTISEILLSSVGLTTAVTSTGVLPALAVVDDLSAVPLTDADNCHGTCASAMPPKKRFLVQEMRTPEKGHSCPGSLKSLEVVISDLQAATNVSTATTASSDIISKAVTLSNLGLASSTLPDTDKEQLYSTTHDSNSVTAELRNPRRSSRQRRQTAAAQDYIASSSKLSKKRSATPRKAKAARLELSASPNVKVMTPGQGSVVINLKDRMPIHVPGIVVHPKNTSAELSKDYIINQLVGQMQKASSDLLPVPGTSRRSMSNSAELTTGSVLRPSGAQLPDPKLSEVDRSHTGETVNNEQLSLSGRKNLAQERAIETCSSSKNSESLIFEDQPRSPQQTSLQAKETLSQETVAPTPGPLPLQSPQLLIDESDTDCVATLGNLGQNLGDGTMARQTAVAHQSHLLMMYDGGSVDLLMTPEKLNTAERFSTISPSAGIFSVIGRGQNPEPSPKKKTAKTNLLESFLEESRRADTQRNSHEIAFPHFSGDRNNSVASRGERPARFSDHFRSAFKRPPRKAPVKRASLKRRGTSGLYMCNKVKNMVRIEPKRQGIPAVRRYIVQADQGCSDTVSSGGKKASEGRKGPQTSRSDRKSEPSLKSKTTRSGRHFGSLAVLHAENKHLEKPQDQIELPSKGLCDTVAGAPVDRTSDLLKSAEKKPRKQALERTPGKKNRKKSAGRPPDKNKRLPLADRGPIMNWSYEEIQAKLDAIHGKKNSSGVENRASDAETKKPAFSSMENRDSVVENRAECPQIENQGSDYLEAEKATLSNCANGSEVEKQSSSLLENGQSLKTRGDSLVKNGTGESLVEKATLSCSENCGGSLAQTREGDSEGKNPTASVTENHSNGAPGLVSVSESRNYDLGMKNKAEEKRNATEHSSRPVTCVSKHNTTSATNNASNAPTCRIHPPANEKPDGEEAAPPLSHTNEHDVTSAMETEYNKERNGPIASLPVPSFNLDQLEPLDLSLSSWAHYARSPLRDVRGPTAPLQMFLPAAEAAREPVAEATHKDSKHLRQRKKKFKRLQRKTLAPKLKKMDISKFLDSLDYSDPRIAHS